MKEQMILDHLPLVRQMAKMMAGRIPVIVDFDDLVSSGTLGLIDAAHKFDPARGFAFKTYAQHRIRGAMLDYLRAWDWVPKSVRAKARSGLTESPPKILSLNIIINDDENRPLTLADLVPDLWADDPVDIVVSDDVLIRIRAVVHMLNAREFTVIRRYYWDRCTLAAIGEELGVTESRVSQMKKIALLHLREFLHLEGLDSM